MSILSLAILPNASSPELLVQAVANDQCYRGSMIGVVFDRAKSNWGMKINAYAAKDTIVNAVEWSCEVA